MQIVRFTARREQSEAPLYMKTPEGVDFKKKLNALAKEYQKLYPGELLSVTWAESVDTITSTFQWASSGLSNKFADMISDRLTPEQVDRYIYMVENNQQLWFEQIEDDGEKTEIQII